MRKLIALVFVLFCSVCYGEDMTFNQYVHKVCKKNCVDSNKVLHAAVQQADRQQLHHLAGGSMRAAAGGDATARAGAQRFSCHY